ncbi:MAG: tRNA preQ1(34) S-adenosylmethionine ribosyltransferase-isomerase QueA [Firmicutes bacterium]|nr:tRNA preQ1(34) S-adenosylmethionine ribosyltransferase-isomerase QueA [Bacillota bacterium]
MKVDEFDYYLPPELIAQHPLPRRDDSRLLVVHRAGGALEHRRFHDLPQYLLPGDVLVINDTKVRPARLWGVRPTGGKVEVLLLNPLGGDCWEALVRPGRRVRSGECLEFGGGLLRARVLERTVSGGRKLAFEWEGDFSDILARLGEMPLPPYIKEPLRDVGRYQTVYAREEGSAAAPTAGLHFTEEILSQIQGQGIEIVAITLHVGLGTFRPVQTDLVEEHTMHAEFYAVSEEGAAVINRAKEGGGRVFAVGTTVARTLETVGSTGRVKPGSGWTDIFIYPGYTWKVVDCLLTNFHLPRSTLLMLVSSFGGTELMRRAYQEAIRERYRFFSFGDACLII